MKHLIFALFVPVIFFSFCFLPISLNAQDNLQWISFPNASLEVDGAPWFNENSPDLFRLPKRLQNIIREPVWNLAQNPSGVRIRFKSDCTALGIRFENPFLSGMSNMHRFGQSGIDLYVDGSYLGTAIHGEDKQVEHIFFKDIPKQKREFVLYLPLYNGAKITAIGVSADTIIEQPSPFALPKPVVFYGTSITQGGCASRAGMSYEAILCRALNLDFVNLGFSGNGKGEKEMAEALAEIDASCFVLDFMANNPLPEDLEAVYEPFVRTLRQKYPSLPIILVTQIYAISESPLLGGKENMEAKRDIVRKTAAKLIAEGDKNLVLVEGHSLLGPELAGGLVDGVHPNDLGFQAMADRLSPILAQMLQLPTPQTVIPLVTE